MFKTVYAMLADEGCNPTPHGRQYVGQKSVTVSGIPCQAWASTSPHGHRYTEDSMYPDGSVTDASNYCRNPDSNWDGGIWCYTMDPNKIWELCSVPTCGTIRYDTRCYFNVRSKADMSRLNLPHGNDN